MPHMPTIKIGPYRIPVKYVKDLMVGRRAAFGAYSDDPHLIELDKTLQDRPNQLLSTVIHESLEAMNCIHSIGLKHDQIEQLSTSLTQLFKDNRFVRGLVE